MTPDNRVVIEEIVLEVDSNEPEARDRVGSLADATARLLKERLARMPQERLQRIEDGLQQGGPVNIDLIRVPLPGPLEGWPSPGELASRIQDAIQQKLP